MGDIELVHMSTLKAVPCRGSIEQEFIVKGKGRKTKKLLAAMKKKGAITEKTWVEYKTVRISSDKLADVILRSQHEILQHWNQNGQRLVIGSRTLAELMNEEPITQYFKMHLDVKRNLRSGGVLFGLQIEIVPWMEGMVILP